MQVSHLPPTNPEVLLLEKKKAVGSRVGLLFCLIVFLQEAASSFPQVEQDIQMGLGSPVPSSSLAVSGDRESPSASLLVPADGGEGGLSLQTHCALENSCTNMFKIKSLDWLVWKIA